MEPGVEEDWKFQITVIQGEASRCRLGLETGDTFSCEYACPPGFCPKTMATLYTLCEIIRCGGNFKQKGSREEYTIDFPCADACIQFRLSAQRLPSGDGRCCGACK